MNRFRIIADGGLRWTVKDEAIDAVTFLSQHFYDASITKVNFLVLDGDIVNVDKIIAIEQI